MIKIRRTSCPSCLDKPDHEFAQNDCKREEVKTSLFSMQHGKCCYCERSLRNLGNSEKEVEHYYPQHACKDTGGNIQWHVANKWDNLLYACRTCNSNKGPRYPFNDTTGQRQIIDPANEAIDPEDHIDFRINDIIITFIAKGGSSLGRSTIGKLKFTERTDLWSEFRRIKGRIDLQVLELVNAITENDTITIDSKKVELSKVTSAHQPHAAFYRKYISKRIEEINANKREFEAAYGRPFNKIEINIHKGYETET